MRSRCVAFVALLTGPLYAQGDVPTTLDAALEKATHELVDLRDETRKVFALDDTSYLAVYSDSPLHTWEGGQWSTITAEQSGGAETPRGPAGKLAQYIGFVVNGGGLRLTPEGEHQWDNNFRRLKKWNTNNHTYRISFAGYTPIPGGKYPIGYAHLILYQKTNSINCGAEVRLLDRISGVAEEMYDEIDKGLLIRSDPHIGRPQIWNWTPSDYGGKIAVHAGNHSRVFLGLRGALETTASDPCEIGRWGASDAPDWPAHWKALGLHEPVGSFTLLALLLANSSSAKVVAQEVDSWGQVKEETLDKDK